MSLFFFGNNLYKNKETFNIFTPRILEVYRILFVKTTLESIMFYYTFSVINTMFVPCTALLYEQNSNNKIVHNSIEHFLCNLSDYFSDDALSCLWIVFTNSVFQPSENSQAGWDLGNRMARGYRFDAKWVYPMGSYAWSIQVFCLRNEVAPHFPNKTLTSFLEHNTWIPQA